MSPRPNVEDVRRREILQAACELIARRGYHAVRVADIATATGVSTGTVHYYFPGRHDVLDQALQFSVEQAFVRQDAALAQLADARDRLMRLIDLQVADAPQPRSEWSVWLQSWGEASLRPEIRAIHAEVYARWQRTVFAIIRRGQRQGTFAPGRAEERADLFCALLDGLGIQALSGSDRITTDRMRELLVDFAQRELFARAPAASAAR